MARWRSGLTHQPFTLAVSGVSIPYGSPNKAQELYQTVRVFFLFSFL